MSVASTLHDAIQFTHIDVYIDNVPILHNISTTLTEKRIGVIGNNGSGKSSFARCATGLVSFEKKKEVASDIMIHGTSIRSLKKDMWKYVNMTFQNPDQQIIMPSVKEELAVGLKHCDFSEQEKEEKIEYALGLLRVPADQSCHSLSAGQKRMLCLLSILLIEPRTIILDEPTTFLDLPAKEMFMTFLETLDLQVIMITHDLFLIEHFPHTLCFHQGSIHYDGDTASTIQEYKAIW